MSREYKHIKEYEKEKLELKSQGMPLKEIGEKFGFTYKQVHNFICRYNVYQHKLAAGVTLKKKGRPAKDSEVTKADKIDELRYKLTRKDTA